MAAEHEGPVVLHYYMKLYWGNSLDRLDEDMQAALRFVGEAQRDAGGTWSCARPTRWRRSFCAGTGVGGGSGGGSGSERRSRPGAKVHVYKVESIPTSRRWGSESPSRASRRAARWHKYASPGAPASPPRVGAHIGARYTCCTHCRSRNGARSATRSFRDRQDELLAVMVRWVAERYGTVWRFWRAISRTIAPNCAVPLMTSIASAMMSDGMTSLDSGSIPPAVPTSAAMNRRGWFDVLMTLSTMSEPGATGEVRGTRPGAGSCRRGSQAGKACDPVSRGRRCGSRRS